jgi:hypothetical protein
MSPAYYMDTLEESRTKNEVFQKISKEVYCNFYSLYYFLLLLNSISFSFLKLNAEIISNLLIF